MLRQTLLSLVALFSLAACSGAASPPSPSDAPDDGVAPDAPSRTTPAADAGDAASNAPSDPHPSWLLGSLGASDVVAENGAISRWSIEVRADGTATMQSSVGAPRNSTAAAVKTSTETTWEVVGDKIQLGSDSFGLKVSAACNVVQLIDGAANHTYEIKRTVGQSSSGCPDGKPVLSEVETRLANIRSWESGPDLLLFFHDTGEVSFANVASVTNQYMLFSVDSDGTTMRWTSPDGTEVAVGSLKFSGDSFVFCQTGHPCLTWKKYVY